MRFKAPHESLDHLVAYPLRQINIAYSYTARTILLDLDEHEHPVYDIRRTGTWHTLTLHASLARQASSLAHRFPIHGE
jgi:hypothetical protein